MRSLWVLCLALLLVTGPAASGKNDDKKERSNGGGDSADEGSGVNGESPTVVDCDKKAESGSGDCARNATRRDQLAEKWKTIRFHFGANFEPFDFLKIVPGEPETQDGFGVSFVKGVCRKFNLDCHLIRDSYSNCWTTRDFPGRGIQSGWYDACSMYFDTPIRHTGVTLSHPIVNRTAAGILARLDENGKPVVHPMDDDLKGIKMGFVGGWSTSAASFKHLTNGCTGRPFTNYVERTVRDRFDGPDEAMAQLLDGKIDALFVFGSLIEERKECVSSVCNAELYKHLGKRYAWIHTGIFEYQLNGVTLALTPKGSDLVEFLNPLIKDFIETREYADLCAEYVGEQIRCFTNSYIEGPLYRPLIHLTDQERMNECIRKDDNPTCGNCATGFCTCAIP